MDISTRILILLMTFAQSYSLIQFYSGYNFEGLIGEYASKIEESCINLGISATTFVWQISSIRTDQCIMIYTQYNCRDGTSVMYSYMLKSGNYANLQDVRHEGFESYGRLTFDKNVLSFGKCESTLSTGGSVTLHSSKTAYPIMYLHGFCHRVNISDQIAQQTGFIINPNSCVVVHLKNSNKSFKLEAGWSPLAGSVGKYPEYFNDFIGGISPCNTSRNCYVLFL